MLRAALTAFLLLFAGTVAHAATLPEPKASYSAMQTVTVGGTAMDAKLFHDRGRERREMTVQGMNSVMLVLPDQEKAYVVQPQLGMAMEVPLSDPESGADMQQIYRLPAEVVGRETIAGLDTKKYKVSGRGPSGAGFDGHVWATDDGIYVRVQGTATDGKDKADIRMDVRDVVRGPQDPALFRLPEGVRIMTLGPIQGRLPEILKPGRPS